MASILDRFNLDSEEGLEKFEKCIVVGMKPSEIAIAFRKSPLEMDDWCLKTYGQKFKVVYESIREMGIGEFLDIVNALGMRGNPSALGIINEALREKENNSVVKIVFNTNLPEESDDDKEV